MSVSIRRNKIFDAVLFWGNILLWLLIILIMLAFLYFMLAGALRGPKVFGAIVLRISLITISFVFLLLVANVTQRIYVDVNEGKRNRDISKAKGLIEKQLRTPEIGRDWQFLGSYLNKLDIVEIASRDLSEKEREILKEKLRELSASGKLEMQALNAPIMWKCVRAILLIGWLGDPGSVPLLKEALKDPETNIAFAAADALTEVNTADAYSAILDAIKEGKLARSRLAAFAESSRYGQPISLLEERANDEDPEVRFWIAYLIGRTRDKTGLPVLSRMALNDAPRVRMNVAKALGWIGDRGAAPVLKAMLNDRDWLVRSQAAKTIGIIKDERLIKELMPLLRDKEWWVRQNSALSLEKLGNDAIPYLKKYLFDKDRFARNKSAEILGRLGVVSNEIKKLTTPGPEAEEARQLLLAIGRADAVNIIEDEMLKAAPEIKSLLIKILGEIGDPRSLPTLEKLKENEPAKVRDNAAQAIDHIKKAV